MTRFEVIVKPNSPKNEITSFDGTTYKVNVKAPPDKNKANMELIKFLKKSLKRPVRIISGFTSRHKVVDIE